MKKEQTGQEFSSRKYPTTFYGHRFSIELISYLEHLISQGWALNTARGIGAKLMALGARVDIASGKGVTLQQIEAAADDWMKVAPHHFRRKIGPHKARTKFISNSRDWLRFLGRYVEPNPKPLSFAQIIDEYTRFLDEEKGMSQRSIHTYEWNIVQLLRWLNTRRRTLSNMKINDVDLFLARPRERPYSRRTVASFVGAFRSFFRFAQSKKYCSTNIAEALDAPRIYYQETLPLGPSWPDVRRMISSIGVTNTKDIRDRAILTLLAIYGFRAGEVCRLQLEDLNWQREQIKIWRSKRVRQDLYPLAREAGEAILLYLRKARPKTSRREVFLRSLPPFEPLTVPGLGTMVSLRLHDLGVQLQHFGPHMLRHSCASHLLNVGFSLKEIGDHLGHTDPRSTRIYAKVDLKGLREVARFDLGDLL